MPFVSTPVIDEHNPCYCPDTSAGEYLDRLREQRAPAYIPTFFDSSELPHTNPSHGEHKVWGQPLNFNAAPDSDNLEFTLNRAGSLGILGRSGSNIIQNHPLSISYLSAARSDSSESNSSSSTIISSSSSDFSRRFSGSAAHARSSLIIDDCSYELDGKASPIDTFFPPRTGHSPSSDAGFRSFASNRNEGAHTKELEDALYGPNIGTETTHALHALILRIEMVLPGIRLQDRLYALNSLKHQSIVDALGQDGFLDNRILELFRRSEIWRIDLQFSLTNENGLNLSGVDALKVIAKPNSFQCLTELNLSEATVQDLDLIHIHHLPRLSTLLLNNTGIGNEALFHLVALRRTLAYLHLEENPLIDDEGVPALLPMTKLRFLSLIDTGIGMPGIRRLALHVREAHRRIDMIMPNKCEEYLHRLSSQYVIQPEPPLVVDPEACTSLSAASLRRNLAAHAAQNSAIVTGGTKAEMAERLTALLQRREADCAVRAMLWGEDDQNDHSSADEEMVSEEY